MANAQGNPTSGAEQSVPATEIVRNFSVWQDRSSQRPVTILHHGRPRSVLLSLDQYGELLMAQGSQDEREERLRGQLDIVLAHMNSLFMQIDADMLVMRANHTAAAFLGQKQAALVGQPLDDLFSGSETRRVIQTVRKVLASGLPERFKTTLHDKELLMEVAPFPAGAALFGTDIDIQGQMEDLSAQRDAQEQLLSMMTGCAVGEINPKGMLTRVHPSLHRLLRFRPEIIGKTAFCDLFDDASRRKCGLHVAHVLAGKGPVCCRADILTRDRDAVPIRLFLAPKMIGEVVDAALFSILDDSLGALPMR